MAHVYILEGTWWSTREVPQILPYFDALARSHRGIQLSHRTIRSADDIEFWLKKIPKDSGAFVYLACHAERQQLQPVDRASAISWARLLDALSVIRDGAVDFLHFGCCEMIAYDRRKSHHELAERSGARWTSGYQDPVDWLQSTLLDLALVAELFVPWAEDRKNFDPKLSKRADAFLDTYDQLARNLRFSGATRNTGGQEFLVPRRLT